MSVFRAAASDPAYQPPDPSASPGHRVPHQRAPEHGYPEGPTEPLGAARENPRPFVQAPSGSAPFGSASFGSARESPATFGAVQENRGPVGAGRENQGPFGAGRDNSAPFGVPGENAGPFGPAREDPGPPGAVRERAVRESPLPGSPGPAGARPESPEPPAAAPEPEPAAGRRPRRRIGVVLAVLFSLLALAASAAGGWFSWRALEATRAPAPSGRLPSPAASEPARIRPPRPAEYPVTYAKEPLRLQVACAAVLHIDLDEPRADAAEVLADLRYDGGCGTRAPQLSLGVGAAGGSRQVSADADAADCDRAIRTAPLGRGLPVEVKEGAAVCVLTAAAPAGLVLVEIIDVGGSGTAGLRATSWQVPEDR
jgi:hypothetical protein